MFMINRSVVLLVLAVSLGVSAVPAAPQPSQNVPNVSGHITEGLDAYKSNATEGLKVAAAFPGVYLCVNSLFTEPCTYIANITPGACYYLGGIYFNSLSSLGPDPGLKCYGYLNSDCTPAHPNLGPVTYPGIDVKEQFIQDGVNYHDRVNGIICWNS